MPYSGPLARLWHIQAPDLDRWAADELLELARDVLQTSRAVTG